MQGTYNLKKIIQRVSNLSNMTREEFLDQYQDYSEEFLLVDGFDEAILGIDGTSYKVIYSVEKMINILIEEGSSYEDAFEHLEYNVLSAYVGEQTPIFLI